MRLLLEWKLYLPLFMILVISLFYRGYKLSTLTTFGRDQGIDFLTVKQMIDEKKPTLLGIKVSIADFHQGPVYLYLLVPLFLLFQLDPIAGAYTAVLISMLTVALLYLGLARFYDRTIAIFASLIYAVSPEFIRYGNTPLYQHFLPMFLMIALFSLLSLMKSKKNVQKISLTLMIGFSLGICLELHFLAITFVIATLIFLCRYFLKMLPLYFLGIGAGVLPTILFELRNQFLNTKLLLAYINTPKSSEATQTLIKIISPWIHGAARTLGADHLVLGVIITCSLILFAVFIRLKQAEHKTLFHLFLLTSLVSFIFQLLLRSFEPHYLIPVLVLLVPLLPIWLTQLPQKIKTFSLTFFVLMLSFNAYHMLQLMKANHGYYMPEGWSLQKVKKTAEIIQADANGKTNLNLASLLDGDTRAYPLRYVLAQKSVAINSEEVYPQSQVLYVVSRDAQETVLTSTVWEIASIQPASLTFQWELGDGVFLYKLEKRLN